MYKPCPECHSKNLETAKYCFNCEHAFISNSTQGSVKKKKQIVHVLEDETDDLVGNAELTDAAASQLQNIFKIESEEVQRGIRLGDVIGSGGDSRDTMPRRKSKDRRSGKSILKQDGGNSARLNHTKSDE